jgi:ADP-ribosyl-[dinitrogen reductase] hydrolase
MRPNDKTRQRAAALFADLLLGTAVGDSVGLPAEGMAPAAIRRRWPGPWRQRLIFGYGMWSDDTEHALAVAQSLCDEPTDAVAFQRRLARRLRWWFAALPAGVGLATARAMLRLWLFFPADRAGVYSAGNGPAMRSAIIGAFFADDMVRRAAFVAAATRLTHTDPKAHTAAAAMAEIAAQLTRARLSGSDGAQDPLACLHTLPGADHPEWREAVQRLTQAWQRGATVAMLAADGGLARGVTGYAFHSVPIAIYAWARHRGDFRAALEAAYACGGDTDTVGAMVGALAGLEMGEAGIPAEWRQNLRDWPRTISWIRRLAISLDSTRSSQPVPSPRWVWPLVPLRNVWFLLIVLVHGLSRLIPFNGKPGITPGRS